VVPRSAIVAKAILEALFLADDPRSWRLRTVLHISPVNRTAYRARQSFQFHIGTDFIERVWETLASRYSHLPPMPDDGEEIEIILPIDYLPKYVLLDFSLTDQPGKPIALLTSGETANLSLGIFRAAMEAVDARAGDGTRRATDTFLGAAEDIVFCLIASGQREIPVRLKEGTLPRVEASELDYTLGMLRFVEDGLRQFGGPGFPHVLRDLCQRESREFYRRLRALDPDLAGLLQGREGFHSPLFNPLTLFVDFLKTHPPEPEGDVEPRLRWFFAACRRYVDAVDDLADDELRFWPVFLALSRFTRSYPAYARLKIPVGRDFVVKIEQLIPGETTWSWRRPVQSWSERHHQWYPFRLGDSRSLHIEVTCQHPLELEQDPRKTRVVAEGRLIPVEDLFGRAGHNTRYEQHFYTNKTARQLESVLGAAGLPRGPRTMVDLRLGIRFDVDVTTRLAYRLVSVVVAAAGIALLAVYDPAKVRNGDRSLLPLIPILFALFGALGSLKPQESLVAIRMRKYKLAVLIMGAVMALYFLTGLVLPEGVGAVWAWLGGP
jgi:hypothetical protein